MRSMKLSQNLNSGATAGSSSSVKLGEKHSQTSWQWHPEDSVSSFETASKYVAITALITTLGLFYALPSRAEPPTLDRQSLIDSYAAHVRPKGTWESVEWPNTLDLAERGRFGVGALTGNLDPANSFAPYSYFNFQNDCGWYEWFHTH